MTDRHVVYVTPLHMNMRMDHRGHDGVRKVAITLPRISCLDTPMEGDRQKYFILEDEDGTRRRPRPPRP